MVWFLFLLVTAGVVAVFVWDYRKKAASREASRKDRFDRIFQSKAAGGSPGNAEAASAGDDPAAGGIPEMPKPPVPAAVERFLSPPERLAYLLLRAGIPDHEVFARVTLSAVVTPPGTGIDREQHRRRLSQYQIDFVVCDREMRVVAAIELETTAGRPEAAADQRVKTDCLKAAGIRLVQLNPAALPRRDALRALVYGEPTGG